ncbi:hypothetical protein DFJ73DRAFT_766883 [Zopfochytrium polystomum]|nr:hypothetical protein DFJ73DRAFT_766883 [Zopfochytrium polystomum]
MAIARIAAAAAVLAVAATGNVASAAITKIVSFGDSLSDVGNGAAPLTANNGPVIPSDAYYKGHFSNGPVWIENLAGAINASLVSYAVGAATTSNRLVQGWLGGKFGEPLRSDGSIQLVPSVEDQVTSYLASYDETTPKDQILYSIFSGANDNFDDGLKGLNNTGDYYAKAQPPLWSALVAAGAKNFMIPIVPLFGAFDLAYAQFLRDAAADFAKSNPGVRFAFVEFPALFANIVGSPAAFGFSHNTDEMCCVACFSGFAGGAKVCSDPDSYIIWDGLHPSAHTHQIMGATALASVSVLLE